MFSTGIGALKTMTIRNIPAELAEALEDEKRRRGSSLNRTALALLREALGLSKAGPRSNGLHRLAGAWSTDEYQRFEQDLVPFDRIDEDLWR